MSTVDEPADLAPRSGGTDVPSLRAALAWAATVGLCLATALGISSILGATLSVTAIRLAGSGVACGFEGLFAVGAATLAQRSPSLRAPALIGVLASVVAAVVLVIDAWGASIGETVGRIAGTALLLSFALGLSGFLLSQTREEDPPAIRSLMVGTLVTLWVLAVTLIIDVAFASGSTPSPTNPTATGAQGALTGQTFDRFLAVTSLVMLLGLLLLPLLRRAHPAFRGGRVQAADGTATSAS
ncbi:MAG TPA: hypothetical protein VKS25_03615 [Solirubrobacteraceae bacterium]|nr:hypothetical protein [Solirubrobacteraceae bacterium]